MAISFISSAVPAGNPTTSFTVTIPTVQVGDLLILHCTNRDSTTAPTVIDDDTGGETWTKKTSAASKGTLWYKRATSGTSAKTITASDFTGSSAGVLVVLRGAKTSGDPFHQYSRESNASGDEGHLGFTTTIAGCWIGFAVANTANDNAVTSIFSFASHTEGNEKLSTGGSDCASTIKGVLQASAGATGPVSWLQSNGTTETELFAISPPTGTIESRTLTSAGVAVVTFNSKVRISRTLTAAGVGAATLNSKVRIGRTLTSAGVGAFSPVSKATASVLLSAAGVGATSFVGGSTATVLFNAAGQATLVWLPKVTIPAVLTAAGSGTFTPVGFGRQTISVLLSSTGLGTFTPVSDFFEALRTVLSVRVKDLRGPIGRFSRGTDTVRITNKNPLLQAVESGVPIPSQPGRRQFPEITTAETVAPAGED